MSRSVAARRDAEGEHEGKSTHHTAQQPPPSCSRLVHRSALPSIPLSPHPRRFLGISYSAPLSGPGILAPVTTRRGGWTDPNGNNPFTQKEDRYGEASMETIRIGADPRLVTARRAAQGRRRRAQSLRVAGGHAAAGATQCPGHSGPELGGGAGRHHPGRYRRCGRRLFPARGDHGRQPIAILTSTSAATPAARAMGRIPLPSIPPSAGAPSY